MTLMKPKMFVILWALLNNQLFARKFKQLQIPQKEETTNACYSNI